MLYRKKQQCTWTIHLKCIHSPKTYKGQTTQTKDWLCSTQLSKPHHRFTRAQFFTATNEILYRGKSTFESRESSKASSIVIIRRGFLRRTLAKFKTFYTKHFIAYHQHIAPYFENIFILTVRTKRIVFSEPTPYGFNIENNTLLSVQGTNNKKVSSCTPNVLYSLSIAYWNIETTVTFWRRRKKVVSKNGATYDIRDEKSI